MQGITIIRGLCLILLGIIAYGILLWLFGLRIPGRLRRSNRVADSKHNSRKVWIVLGYYILLVSLILSGYLLIRYLVRGGL